uniref:Uncharacterized protein n=1 Tax=Candidatus Kentrum sp. LPFa TaxID=2126335 RepID=A0A450Y1B2_9GAMM|nr:MAG: hypothetical protein BECKLPF1236A_GA0070988_103803 [Candidatus Kentron sp. LPFa]VFK35340.1 MAG: hypothetical protein BECKLPF1236C_GA0070990_103623 [Candidatus Kentron sp. LPFa]
MIGLVFRLASRLQLRNPDPPGFARRASPVRHAGPSWPAWIGTGAWKRMRGKRAFSRRPSMARSSDRPRPKVSRGVYFSWGIGVFHAAQNRRAGFWVLSFDPEAGRRPNDYIMGGKGAEMPVRINSTDFRPAPITVNPVAIRLDGHEGRFSFRSMKYFINEFGAQHLLGPIQ